MAEVGEQPYQDLVKLYSTVSGLEAFYEEGGIPVEIDAVKLFLGLKNLGDQFLPVLLKRLVHNLAYIVSSYPKNQALMTIQEKSGLYEVTLKPDVTETIPGEEKHYEREEIKLSISPGEAGITVQTTSMAAGVEGTGGSIGAEVDGQLTVLSENKAMLTETANAILDVILQSVEK